MHVGAGLDRFPGKIGEFPFDNGKDAKIQREWSRGLGPDTNVKGVEDHSLNALTVPDNVPLPAPAVDYAAIKGCVDALRAGGWGAGSSAQFLYCSIIVPHPAYKSNATYMAAVANLTMTVPAQVPKDKLHPNDVSASTLKVRPFLGLGSGHLPLHPALRLIIHTVGGGVPFLRIVFVVC